jgi:hypothetical protein
MMAVLTGAAAGAGAALLSFVGSVIAPVLTGAAVAGVGFLLCGGINDEK